jgi:mxaA protein
MRYLLLIGFMLLSLRAFAIDTHVSLDRSWGLLVGDEVTETIELPVAVSELDSHSLPQLEKRYGPWLFLKDSHSQGNVLELHFQIINVPAENRQVATPELELRTEAGEFIKVPSVPMQIGSFMESADGESSPVLVPRGDVRLKAAATAELEWQLWLAVGLLVLLGLIWLVWHFGLRPRHRLPFAAAMFELNKMRLLGRKNDDAASRCLHHAFNRSAGRVVVNSDMSALWQQCPWLQPLQQDIERFYQDSAAHFFSPSGQRQKDFEDVLKLTRACRERERLA